MWVLSDNKVTTEYRAAIGKFTVVLNRFGDTPDENGLYQYNTRLKNTKRDTTIRTMDISFKERDDTAAKSVALSKLLAKAYKNENMWHDIVCLLDKERNN